jgi:broad specificity phosphatase PhoE
MPQKRVFIFVRHGESLSNITHKGGFATAASIKQLRGEGYNSINVPLTNRGQNQAELAGNLFYEMFILREKDTKFILPHATQFQIHSSGFKRAHDTQNIFTGKMRDRGLLLHAQESITPILRERYPGVGFFMTKKQFTQEHAKVATEYQEDRYHAVPPQGESFSSRESDVTKFVNESAANSYGNVILAFTHGGFMMALEKLYSQEVINPSTLRGPKNCEMYILTGEVVEDRLFTCTLFQKINLLETFENFQN